MLDLIQKRHSGICKEQLNYSYYRDKYPYNKSNFNMGYNIVTIDKGGQVAAAGVSNVHIASLYGGLKNSLGAITDNLKLANLNESIVNPGGWCTITLNKVDDTAVKVLASCTENTSASERKCEVKLKYGDKTSATKVTITLLGKSSITDPEPSKNYQMTIGFANNFTISDMHVVWFSTLDDMTEGYNTNLLANVTLMDTDWTAGVDVVFNEIGLPAYTDKSLVNTEYFKPGDTTKLYLYFRGTVENNGTNNGFGIFRATTFTANGDNRFDRQPFMYVPLDIMFFYNEDNQNYECSTFIMVTSIVYCGAA